MKYNPPEYKGTGFNRHHSLITAEPPKKYTIVLAGNLTQYNHFLEEQGHTDTDCIYGQANTMRGIIARDVVEYGTFYERSDANELRELAKSRIRLAEQNCIECGESVNENESTKNCHSNCRLEL